MADFWSDAWDVLTGKKKVIGSIGKGIQVVDSKDYVSQPGTALVYKKDSPQGQAILNKNKPSGPSTTPSATTGYVSPDPKMIEDEQKRLEQLKLEQEKKLRQYERQIRNQERKYQSSIAGMQSTVNELEASAPYDLQTTMWQGHPLTVKVDKKYWIDENRDTVQDANEIFNKEQAVLKLTAAYKKMQSDYANWDSNAWESYEDYEDDVSSNASSINKAIADMETYQSQGMGMYVKDDTYYFFSPSSRDVATWLELSPSERPKYLSYVSGTSMVNWNAMGLSKERIYGTGTTAWGFFTPWEWGKQLGASGMADWKAMELNVFTDFWGMTGNLIQAPFSSQEQNALRAADWEQHGYDVLLSTSEPRKGEKANDYYGRILSSEPAKQLMSWGLSFGIPMAMSYYSPQISAGVSKGVTWLSEKTPKGFAELVSKGAGKVVEFGIEHPQVSYYGAKYGIYAATNLPKVYETYKSEKSYNTITQFVRGLGNYETRWALMETGWEAGKTLQYAKQSREFDKWLANEKKQWEVNYGEKKKVDVDADWMNPKKPLPPREKSYYFSEQELEPEFEITPEEFDDFTGETGEVVIDTEEDLGLGEGFGELPKPKVDVEVTPRFRDLYGENLRLSRIPLTLPLSRSRTDLLSGRMQMQKGIQGQTLNQMQLQELSFEELVGQIQEPIQDTIEEQEQDIITPTETTPTEDYFDWNETIPNIPFFVIKKLPEEEEEEKKELYTKKRGKKSLLLKKKKGEKGLLSDLLSVTRSQALYGTATHPRLTKKVWAESEKSLFKTVPTVELRKKGRQFRNLVGSGNVSLPLGESGKKNLMGESKMNNLFGKKTKGGRKNAYY